MTTENLNELHAFVVVATERSFTRAAARLGLSRSALSRSMSMLEARLGVRLLIRTTRSVSTTAEGETLLTTLAPRLQEIDETIASIRSRKDRPAGSIRITSHDHAIATALWPRLLHLLKAHPEISIEFSVDYAMTDIAAHRFDAGVRVGNRVDKDMIAVQIAPELRMAVVASPAYLENRTLPSVPEDLTHHQCINLRLPTHGGLYAWDLEKNGTPVKVKVQGQTVFNTTGLMLQASLDGMGCAYVPYDLVQHHIEAGRLAPVLKSWWPRFPGYHLYYANRRHISPALALVIEALRYRAPGKPAGGRRPR